MLNYLPSQGGSRGGRLTPSDGPRPSDCVRRAKLGLVVVGLVVLDGGEYGEPGVEVDVDLDAIAARHLYLVRRHLAVDHAVLVGHFGDAAGANFVQRRLTGTSTLRAGQRGSAVSSSSPRGASRPSWLTRRTA